MENVYCGDKDDAPSECLRCKETVTTAGGARHVRCEILWDGRPLPRYSTLNNGRGGVDQHQHNNPSNSTTKEQSSGHASCNVHDVRTMHHDDDDSITFDRKCSICY
jgi:hypothetical protein